MLHNCSISKLFFPRAERTIHDAFISACDYLPQLRQLMILGFDRIKFCDRIRFNLGGQVEGHIARSS